MTITTAFKEGRQTAFSRDAAGQVKIALTEVE